MYQSDMRFWTYNATLICKRDHIDPETNAVSSSSMAVVALSVVAVHAVADPSQLLLSDSKSRFEVLGRYIISPHSLRVWMYHLVQGILGVTLADLQKARTTTARRRILAKALAIFLHPN